MKYRISWTDDWGNNKHEFEAQSDNSAIRIFRKFVREEVADYFIVPKFTLERIDVEEEKTTLKTSVECVNSKT